MANEFVARNGLIAQDTSRISGSLLVTGGNIGVGTATPANRLHVIQETSTAGISVSGIVGVNPQLRATDGTRVAKLQALSSTGIVGTESNNDFAIYTNNAEIVRITTTGNVGIGSTAPTSKLQVRVPESAGSATGFTVVGNINSKVVALGVNATYAFIQSHGSVPLYINELGNNVIINPATGNVAIGKTSPLVKLDVSGSVALAGTDGLRIGAAGDNTAYDSVKLYYSGYNAGAPRIYLTPRTTPGSGIVPTYFHLLNTNGSSTTSNNTMGLLVDGSVGIGTTAPLSKLEVDIPLATSSSGIFLDMDGGSGGAIDLRLGSSVGPHIVGNTLPNNTVRGAYGASRMFFTSLGFSFDYSSTTTGNRTWTTHAVINTSGNVGIGTTSPNSRLDVRRPNSGIVAEFQTTAGSADEYADIKLISGNSGTGSLGTILRHQRIGTGGADFIILTNPTLTGTPTEKVRITSAGNVGIGTSAPTGALQVHGVLSVSNNSVIGQGSIYGTSGAASYATLKLYDSSIGDTILNNQGYNIQFQTAGSAKLYIQNNGNVGIGTTSPTNRLHVSKTDGSNELIAIRVQNNLGYSEFGIQSNYARILTNGTLIYAGTNGAQFYYYGGNIVMSLNLANVGIGTTNPTDKLDVFSSSNNQRLIRISHPTSPTSASAFIGFNSDGVTDNMIATIGVQYSNLYYNVLNIDRSTRNVGIGTTTPGATLDVVGNVRAQSFTGSFSGSAAAPGLNTNIIYNSSGVLAGSNNFVFDGTNVGIGTSSPKRNLDISTTGSPEIVLGALSGGTNQKYWRVYTANDIMRLGYVNDAFSSGVDVLNINRSGNVGIGTTAPAEKFHIAGGMRIYVNGSDSQNIGIYQANSSNTEAFLWQQSSTGASLNLWAYSATTAASWNNRVTFTAVGNVGIGTTAPGEKLQVQGNIRFGTGGQASWGNGLLAVTNSWDGGVNSYPTIGGYGGSTGALIMLINPHTPFRTDNPASGYSGRSGLRMAINAAASTWWDAGLAGDFYHIYRQGTGEFLRITNVGNVGINTTSPIDKLEVAGNIRLQNSGRVYLWRDNNSNYIDYNNWISNTGATHTIQNAGAGGLTFKTGADTRMFISSSGNVGIGVTTPNARLQVSGSSNTVNVKGSGSALFSVDGTSGRLFQVDDSLSGSLFSVNTAAGLPVIEAFSDNTVRIGQFGQRALFVSQSRVGIGLENPTTNLHVSGTTGGVFEVDGVNAVNALYVSSSGAVGIGTTNPLSKLQIGTLASTSTATPDTLSLGGTFSNSAGSNIKFKVYDPGGTTVGGMSVSSGQIEVNTWSTGKLAFYRGAAQSMIIDASSNVGIGTTAPAYKLDVNGETNSVSGFRYNGVPVIYNTPTDVYANIRVLTSNSNFNDGMYINYNSSGSTSAHLRFFANAANERMRIDAASGNVGIGTTTAGARLEVSTNSTLPIIRARYNASYYTDYDSNGIDFRGSSQTFDIKDNGSSVIRINSGGSVGIGTTAPKQKLEVAGAGGKIAITNTGTTNYAELLFYEGSTAKADIWVNGSAQSGFAGANSLNIWQGSNAPIAFYTNGTNERMRIDQNGNLGIGVTSPIAKLHAGVDLSDLAGQTFTNTGAIITSIGVDHTATRTNALSLMRDGTSGVVYAGLAAFDLSRWSADSVNARTQLDIRLADTTTAVLTDVLSLRSNGNVGIGSNTPGTTLDVVGNVRAQSFTGSFSGSAAAPGSNTNVIYNSSGVLAGSNSFVFNGTNVGIGTTSPSTAKLVVFQTGGTQLNLISGDALGSADVLLRLTSANDFRGRGIWMDHSGGAGSWYAGVPYTGGSYSIGYDTTQPEYKANSKFLITTTGNVGIGINLPTTKLHVSGTTGGVFEVDGANGINSLYVSSSGNVGIGTIAPGGIFEVFQQGTGRTRGDLLVDANNGYVIVGRLSSTTADVSSFKVRDRLNRAYFDVNTATKYISFNPEIGDITMQIASGYGFKVNTSQFVVSATNGNVGIGTTTPAYKLDINGTMGVTGVAVRNTIIQTNTDNHLVLTTTNSAGDVYSTYENSADANNAWAIGRGNDGVFRINYSTGATYTSGTTTNRLSIDTTGAATFNSSVTAVSFVETSTREKKDNIQSYSTDINKFKQLEPVSFTWKDTGKSDVGLIAEEVDQLFPEFVSKTDEGEVTGINYGKLTTILINIVKQQQERIEKLEQQINK